MQKVIDGKVPYAFVAGDSLAKLREMPEGSVDLVFGSPPYEDARLYGELGFALAGEKWVEWMVQFFQAAVPVTRGLVALVVGHGKTKGFKWSSTPSKLEADLDRMGFHLRAPGVFGRVGIFGSGGPDYFRHDIEWIVTVQNTKFAQRIGSGGPRLPWSNNVACGHVPVYGPGGEASYRTTSGRRVDQWGGSSTPNKGADRNGSRNGSRRKDGDRQESGRPSHRTSAQRRKDGHRDDKEYRPPALANPGNVAEEMYTAEEVRELLSGLEGSLVSKGAVGGGHMGHKLAHDNEAPFPLWLAERYVLSFCPPNGIVLDPFCGSGTTIHAAHENKRRGIGIDLRAGQVQLAKRRLAGVTPRMFVESDDEYLRRLEAKAAEAKGEADHPKPSKKARSRRGVAGDPVRHPGELAAASDPE
jgi:hypothetical protein